MALQVTLLLAMVFTFLSTGVSSYPYGLRVTDIRENSVNVHWQTTERLVEEFVIHCSGIRSYVTVDEFYNTEVHAVSHYVPKGMDHVLLGNLKPNFNYTCLITEQLEDGAQILNGKVSEPLQFETSYAAPEAPNGPQIIKTDEFVKVLLFSSSSKFGPISGYKVQFHVFDPLSRPDESPPLALSRSMADPFTAFSAHSIKSAQASSVPKSFQISFDGKTELPDHILLHKDLMKGALKNGAQYFVITVAYIKIRNSTDVVFNPSLPSQIFTPVGHGPQYSMEASGRSPSQLGIAIGIGVVIPCMCIMYVCCVGAVLICREWRLNKMNKKSPGSNDGIMSSIKNMAQRRALKSWLTLHALRQHLNRKPLQDEEAPDPPATDNGEDNAPIGQSLERKPQTINITDNPQGECSYAPQESGVKSNNCVCKCASLKSQSKQFEKNSSRNDRKNMAQSSSYGMQLHKVPNTLHINERGMPPNPGVSVSDDSIKSGMYIMIKTEKMHDNISHPVQVTTVCTSPPTKKHCRHKKGKNSRSVPDLHTLQYTTSATGSDHTLRQNSTAEEFFSPIDSDIDHTKKHVEGGNLSKDDKEKNKMLPSSSASMFIPRGLSNGLIPLYISETTGTEHEPVLYEHSSLSSSSQSQLDTERRDSVLEAIQ